MAMMIVFFMTLAIMFYVVINGVNAQKRRRIDDYRIIEELEELQSGE